MKRIALVTVVGFVALCGVLLAAPNFIDWNKYKSQIQTQLQQATGLEFDIAGNIDLAILPFPHVSIANLTVKNPEAEGVTLLTIEEANVSVALGPLLSKQVQVESVNLVKPDINLLVLPNGDMPWMTTTLKSKQDSSSDTAAAGTNDFLQNISLDSVSIEEGRFTYKAQNQAKSLSVQDVNLKIKADTVLGPYDGEGQFVYDGKSVKFSADSGALEMPLSSLSLNADVTINDDHKASFSGVVGIKPSIEVQGDASFSSGDLAALSKSFTGKGAAPALAKPASVSGILTASPDTVSFNDAQIQFGGIKTDGRLLVSNLSGAKASAPLTISTVLEGKSGINLDDLMGPKAKKSDTPGVNLTGFLPKTITLPKDIAVDAKVTAPSITFSGQTLNNPVTTVTFKDKVAKAEINAKLSEADSLNAIADIAFESRSKSAKGGVTLTDPALNYSLAVKAATPKQSLLPLVPEGIKAKAANVFVKPVNIAVKGGLKANSIVIDSGTIDIMNDKFIVGGSYQFVNGARHKASVTVNASGINADEWMAVLADENKQAVPLEQTIKNVVAGLSFPFDLDFSAALQNLSYGDIKLNKFDILASKSNQALNIKTLDIAEASGASVLAKLDIADLAKLSGINGSVQAKVSSVSQTIDSLNIPVKSLPRGVKGGSIISEFKGEADNLGFTANVAALNGTADITGSLAKLLTAPSLSNITVRLKHPNYVELIQMAAPDFKSGVAIRKDLDVFTTIKQVEGGYDLQNLEATVGPSKMTGAVSYKIAEGKANIVADLSIDQLPLDELMGHQADHKGAVRAQPLRNNPEVRWSSAPINTAWLDSAAADVKIKAGQFSYGPWALSNANLAVTLQNGILDLKTLTGAMYGGTVDVTAKVSKASAGQAEMLTVSNAVSLSNVDLESFVSSFSGSRVVQAKGTVSIKADTTTLGGSVAGLVQNLEGTSSASGTDILFTGFDLARLSRTLAQPSSSWTDNATNLLGSSLSGGQTQFDTLEGAYSIQKGIINFDTMKLTGPQANINVGGNVNLPLWTVDLKTVIDLIEPEDAPELSVVFKGPLDRPGSTFGQSALQGYIQNIIGSEVQKAIGDSEFLKDLPFLQGRRPETQQQVPAPANDNIAPAQQGAQPSEQQPAKQQPQQPATPEDAVNSILKGVLGGL